MKRHDYIRMKKLCGNTVFQDSAVHLQDEVVHGPMLPRWTMAEEYILSAKYFGLYWHTPYVSDGGIYVTGKVSNGCLVVESHSDGGAGTGKMLDKSSVTLDRYANRMIQVNVDGEVSPGKDYGTGKISIICTEDPSYRLWTVKFFDYIANYRVCVTVRARSMNEAKVIAWYYSPWHQCQEFDKPIDPSLFEAHEYTPPQILTRSRPTTTGDDDIADTMMAKQIAICEQYDRSKE